MFDSIEIHIAQQLDREAFSSRLVEYGYRHCKKVAEEGDFAPLGDTVTVYPLTFEYPLRIELADDHVARIRSLDPITYDPVQDHQAVIILPIRGLSKRRISARRPHADEENAIDNFVDIDAGDYVVHVDHGIGRYLGIEQMKVGKEYREHLVVEYADGDKLYVPFDDIGKVQKYLGFERRPPKLYKLGGKLWRRVKDRVKSGVYKVAVDLLELQAKRSSVRGFAYAQDTDWQKKFEGEFPYRETPDQTRSTAEVKRDMEAAKPMDRLICGDVGYGKTEVALRAAFKAVMDLKQVAMLVPTTILAEQHFDTFRKRMQAYPIRIEMLSRFRTDAEQEPVIAGLKDGSVDIVIGTHRLVTGDIQYKDLGLVIIDEEQRFGVIQKEYLKNLRVSVDVLTLTATPIPRTLYLALMGGRDISTIHTPPSERIPVKTFVTHYDDGLIKEALLREKARGGQTFFVHNRVNGIERIAEHLRELAPGVAIEVAHGQMSERALEKTMIRFIKGEIDCLISTTIVESGIDIPNANTLIVNRADAFGLSDLYQLKGRVGRFKREAFAYFLVPKNFVLSAESQRRLHAIMKYQDLGSGFKLAMEDLQIRGAGNLLGTEQHGYVHAVGFDLYCRLLKGAIETYGSKKKPR